MPKNNKDLHLEDSGHYWVRIEDEWFLGRYSKEGDFFSTTVGFHAGRGAVDEIDPKIILRETTKS